MHGTPNQVPICQLILRACKKIVHTWTQYRTSHRKAGPWWRHKNTDYSNPYCYGWHRRIAMGRCIVPSSASESLHVPDLSSLLASVPRTRSCDRRHAIRHKDNDIQIVCILFLSMFVDSLGRRRHMRLAESRRRQA